jgi:hypothetical protein
MASSEGYSPEHVDDLLLVEPGGLGDLVDCDELQQHVELGALSFARPVVAQVLEQLGGGLAEVRRRGNGRARVGDFSRIVPSRAEPGDDARAVEDRPRVSGVGRAARATPSPVGA